MVLLVIAATLDFAGAASGVFQVVVLRRAAEGVEVSDATAALTDLVYVGIGLLQALAFVVTGIVFLTWLHRAYSNLRAIGTGETRFAPRWAVVWWFVPVANCIRPYQIVTETWRRSEWLNAPGTSSQEVPALVGWWWILFVVSGGIAQVFSRRIEAAESIEETIFATWLGIVSDAMSCVAALLAVVVVATIDRHQQRMGRLAARLPSAEPVPEPA